MGVQTPSSRCLVGHAIWREVLVAVRCGGRRRGDVLVADGDGGEGWCSGGWMKVQVALVAAAMVVELRGGSLAKVKTPLVEVS